MADDLIGSAEACDLLGVDRKTLIRWTRAGRIKAAMKMPGQSGAWLFRRADVERYIRKNREPNGSAA